MTAPFQAACVQLCAGEEIGENVAAAVALIREAKAAGASFIATPENTSLMAADAGAKLDKSFAQEHDPALAVFRALAEELSIWLMIGSLAIKVSETRTANRSFLIRPDGSIAAQYDKIHLFDVDLPGGELYRESDTVAGGDIAVTADLPAGRIGFSVCYDLRFPQLYRALAEAGAFLFTVPAAFTETTGRAHWEVLLRARAIENGAFVLAPAQGGLHANGRRTYGHSLIISPWGEILAQAGTEPGFILAEIDPEKSRAARAQIPSLRHGRRFTLTTGISLAEKRLSGEASED
ncbi:putative amidohydrolase [Rhizomicrobium palustre]|uniref:Putative amidohydrolase n=1 Tax=Rhizomicrobium palustre TaxID=189966 RepID=A0A846N4J2_9PROT|nr:carbon-nitrogen hydrolase family protein [Rhizomicrobium palustre]NIK90007.1 putative amidohydrolase [Rhizomicrobium palustre]